MKWMYPMALLWLLNYIINLLSYKMTLRLGIITGKLAYYLHERGKNKKTLHQAIAAALGIGVDSKRSDLLVREYLKHLGKMVFEILRFDRLKEEWGNQVSVEGLEHLNTALARGNGVILLSAHLGNWEYLLSGLPFLGINEPYVLAWKQPESKVNDLLDQKRTLWGTRLLFSQDLEKKEIERVLTNNGVLLIMGDRYDIGKTKVQFFGFTTGVAAGPFVFARDYRSSIIPIYTIRQGLKHRIILKEPLNLEPLYNNEKSVNNYLQESINMIEDWIRTYPAQWMWIFKRNIWKS
jgi:Kdo2-lipid IVA lauroyltransferase/acyltransferase